MAIEKPPCKDCPDRHINCHSDGECKNGYPEYKKRIEAAREAEAQQNKESWDLTCVHRPVIKIGERMRRTK